MKEEENLEIGGIGKELDELICDIFEILQDIKAINKEQLVINDIPDVKKT
ncbi:MULTISPECIES: hypothetical protein [Pelosinus]|uniref:Uncharacterized protein n=1 Tax=Pelosinus fermentans B4 TaxID=1149862 RepID=I8RE03_9FIRM|nr:MULTISPECIES: hypothetical protein [Pelosinus]EIW17533.1 hypothetical protein FB4_4282 [Pelosinus fermentans B4]EIW23270.1 hypothetical protein FA11_4285 [Pelosinus fermentans A11]OAM92088.1 hypothetical protein FR7_00102 [Pelosinus fermentans DSM 17108]SDQ33006.1 hypothetical protein SAMN04515679_0130 [Pelosinus fermentans]